ncbi:hypothetical protein [Mesorhizobium huakuii]|uniref:Uncharacterized protein n=1 Tax=Mesorhizobium huakuii TaxID=28104 RepID=A0A7G6SQ21_9HYPH|nr:hypothetical protein [Mesorhizobium huakuii]QND56603.1 hypothetical protein HB778_08250 [Mesorhizobium huakuii]
MKVDSEELPRLIETVINTSFYFSNLANKLLYGAEAPSSASPEITYIDYIKLIKRGLETQRREQRRQQELERPRTPSRAAPAITDKHRAPHTLLLVQSLGALVAGLSLAFMGLYAMQGDTTVDLFGQKITSKSAGVIAIFIGAVLIVLMSRRILKTLDLMLR